MNVNLVSYSQSKTFDSLQDSIAYCARVSNPSNQMSSATSEKLLRYLIKHGHWSPFEMASICLEIDTTRDIARQMLSHRSFSFQEFSQRYADTTDELSFETRAARLQDSKNRQMSIEVGDDASLEDRAAFVILNGDWKSQQKRFIEIAKETYSWAIKKGIAKEQARAVLPEGLIQSRLYMSGTVRSWMHYIKLRSTPGTQKEHVEIAKECGKVIKPIFPMIQDFIQ